VKFTFWLMAGALALPVPGMVRAQQAAHEHASRPAEVEAALAAAIAALPQADYGKMNLTRHTGPGKTGIGTSVQIDNPVGMSVVVVIDENGVAHSECAASAPPHVVAGASPEPGQ
jgi:hypothetical protein